MLFERPKANGLIPTNGIRLYKLMVFQMSNEKLKQELRMGYYSSVYRDIVLREIQIRKAESNGKRT